MAWKSIDPQVVSTTIDDTAVHVKAERWEDFTGAIAVSWPPTTEPLVILAGEYSPVDEAAFERACSEGTKL